MALRKTLKWTFAGLAVLFALAYAGLHVWRWGVDERYETVLVIENLSGQSVHNLKIVHNGGAVSQVRRLDPREIFALSNLSPLRGPKARIPDGDIGIATSHVVIAFQREPDAREDQLDFETDWHTRYGKKCLLVTVIWPEFIEQRQCLWMEKPEWQAKPKN